MSKPSKDMLAITRYVPCDYMEEDREGEWVRFDDHEAIVTKLRADLDEALGVPTGEQPTKQTEEQRLLDHFAGLAMQAEIGLQADPKIYKEVSDESAEEDRTTYEYLAEKAYRHAAAMIAERNRDYMNPMNRYREVRTQDEMGDMQDGVYESEHGEYVKVEDLIKWLDAEIALAEENVEIANANASMGSFNGKVVMDTMLATYKAVKAHVQG